MSKMCWELSLRSEFSPVIGLHLFVWQADKLLQVLRWQVKSTAGLSVTVKLHASSSSSFLD